MIKINYKPQLIMALLLIPLGYWIYYTEFKATKQEDLNTKEKKVFNLPPTAQIKTIEVRHPGLQQTYLFECLEFKEKKCAISDKAKWEMLSPKKIAADDTHIANLLTEINRLKSPEVIHTNEEGSNAHQAAQLLQDYGVDPASNKQNQHITITYYENDTEKTITLHVGLEHPVSSGELGNTYAAVLNTSPAEILFVPSTFTTNFTRSTTYWRNKKIYPVERSEIDLLTFINKETLVVKANEKMWTVTKMNTKFQDVPVDNDQKESLVNALGRISAKEFPAENKQEAAKVLTGLKENLQIKLQKKNNEWVKLDFFEKLIPNHSKSNEKKVYLRISTYPGVYEVEPSLMRDLNKDFKTLHIAALLSFAERSKLKSIELASEKLSKKYTLVKGENNKFTFQADNHALSIDTAKIDKFYDQFSMSRIQNIEPVRNIDAKNALHLDFHFENENDNKKISIWKHGNKLYAQSIMPLSQFTYLLNPEMSNFLPWTEEFFKEAPKQETSSDKESQKSEFDLDASEQEIEKMMEK